MKQSVSLFKHVCGPSQVKSMHILSFLSTITSDFTTFTSVSYNSTQGLIIASGPPNASTSTHAAFSTVRDFGEKQDLTTSNRCPTVHFSRMSRSLSMHNTMSIWEGTTTCRTYPQGNSSFPAVFMGPVVRRTRLEMLLLQARWKWSGVTAKTKRLSEGVPQQSHIDEACHTDEVWHLYLRMKWRELNVPAELHYQRIPFWKCQSQKTSRTAKSWVT